MKLLEWVIDKGHEEKIALSLIKRGNVIVNSVKETLPNYQIKENDKIEIIGVKSQYVSRGAHKLEAGIKNFKINFKDKVVLDIGSSTGGFTQVSLIHGAAKVYAVDVGTNQLDFSLRRKTNVISMEKMNLKHLELKMFAEQIDIVVCDVSFISVKRVFDICKTIIEPDKDLIILIKPQYEANSSQVEKGGYVPIELHKSIINEIKDYATTNGFNFIKIIPSPITGKTSKNQEYISWFKRGYDEKRRI